MKIKNLYIFLISGALLSSCQDNFLDLQPISSATTGNFYKTADDIKNAVSGAYASLQAGGISTNNYVFGEVRSDNTLPVASGSVTDQDEFDRFYIRTTNPYINDRWNNAYRAIARCNAILDRIGAISMDENLKSRYTAEVKFIRGLVYFELVRSFGDVPIILKEVTNPDEGYAFGRSPVADVYTQIEKDLTEAEAVLPTTYASADVGRATKGAAKALLGKVYLTQRKFQPAATKLKEVIDLGVYGLLPEYADVFDSNNENHREIVFDIQFRSGGVGEGSPWPNAFSPENSGNAVIPFGGGGNNQPTTDLINSYEPNDKRKNFSLATSYVNASGATIPYNFIRKYRDVPATSGDNDNNIPVIRYADVILMYAEALNEIGYQPTGDAFNYLNQVRTRAGLGPLTANEVPNQGAFRLAMEQERRVELAFESHRWFDLVRTGRAIPVMNSKKDQFRLVKTLTETDLIFPIPQSQIDINREKIQQNPGYN
ncbi:RagB/SusD family nutrient uptake outer membrane protein [Adhaeribacter rhizoryzae]|uniref:RagB/SusD family nutrient uptake outer membrane protein n=1 Tax=Adhaeribacter rhizoryzae TaxID=2607907 RepID=A0A5M6D634_9BACT|nr:RagB/SusD family nutrient uptake outer membrane protein [Adhaeribacter rhizoryzae]KAA5542941.1 RagB/SusD family nutrient uptake outer membrane protein [Adhaeribacter rhizoryzae]